MRLNFFLIMIFSFINLSYPDEYLDQWKNFKYTEEGKSIIQILKNFAIDELKGKNKSLTLKNKKKYPAFAGKLGIFITIVKDKKVRGCFGAFDHQSDDISIVLSTYINEALRSDFRYKPLDIEELKTSKIILTITSQPYPVSQVDLIDISTYGIYIKSSENQPLVFVPWEIKTHSYINNIIKKYINPEIYCFKAVTIK